MCPHCGRNAPLVYRGALAFCSACNKPRPPLSGTAVNLKGKPAKIGGVVASIVGWIVLVLGLAVSVIVGALLQAVLPPSGLWVGGAIGFVVVVASLVLLLGGRTLQKSGERASHAAQKEALNALAEHHKGTVTALAASQSMGISVDEAEAELAALTKDASEGVSLEVDEDGKLYYRFARFAPPPRWPADSAVRVDAKIADSKGVSEPARVAEGDAAEAIVEDAPPAGTRRAE